MGRAVASACWSLNASSASSQLTPFISFSICGMGTVGALAPYRVAVESCEGLGQSLEGSLGGVG